jgi:hypothetical protein
LVGIEHVDAVVGLSYDRDAVLDHPVLSCLQSDNRKAEPDGTGHLRLSRLKGSIQDETNSAAR